MREGLPGVAPGEARTLTRFLIQLDLMATVTVNLPIGSIGAARAPIRVALIGVMVQLLLAHGLRLRLLGHGVLLAEWIGAHSLPIANEQVIGGFGDAFSRS